MKTEHRKGDSYTNRLFQWLREEEGLPISLKKVIKPKVYKVSYNHTTMVLKGYRRPSILFQQVDFFTHWNYAHQSGARPLPFSDGIYTKSKLGCEWGLFEWVEGRHANFSSSKDREAAVRVLQRFHRSTKGIAVLAVPKDPLYIKWERRLEQFEQTRDVFLEYRKLQLYEELRGCMLKQLEKFASYSWGEIEEKAWDNHEWLHGDVAHHNFIVMKNREVRLIDFDLMHTGPKIYDYIQLGQRFLPYLEQQRSTLFLYFKAIEEREIWIQGVLVPADLLREWLYGYRRCQYGESSFSSYLRKLDKAWESRKPFVRYTENML